MTHIIDTPNYFETLITKSFQETLRFNNETFIIKTPVILIPSSTLELGFINCTFQLDSDLDFYGNNKSLVFKDTIFQSTKDIIVTTSCLYTTFNYDPSFDINTKVTFTMKGRLEIERHFPFVLIADPNKDMTLRNFSELKLLTMIHHIMNSNRYGDITIENCNFNLSALHQLDFKSIAIKNSTIKGTFNVTSNRTESIRLFMCTILNLDINTMKPIKSLKLQYSTIPSTIKTLPCDMVQIYNCSTINKDPLHLKSTLHPSHHYSVFQRWDLTDNDFSIIVDPDYFKHSDTYVFYTDNYYNQQLTSHHPLVSNKTLVIDSAQHTLDLSNVPLSVSGHDYTSADAIFLTDQKDEYIYLHDTFYKILSKKGDLYRVELFSYELEVREAYIYKHAPKTYSFFRTISDLRSFLTNPNTSQE